MSLWSALHEALCDSISVDTLGLVYIYAREWLLVRGCLESPHDFQILSVSGFLGQPSDPAAVVQSAVSEWPNRPPPTKHPLSEDGECHVRIDTPSQYPSIHSLFAHSFSP